MSNMYEALHDAKVMLNKIEAAADKHYRDAFDATTAGRREDALKHLKAAREQSNEMDYARGELEALAKRAADSQRDMASKAYDVTNLEIAILASKS